MRSRDGSLVAELRGDPGRGRSRDVSTGASVRADLSGEALRPGGPRDRGHGLRCAERAAGDSTRGEGADVEADPGRNTSCIDRPRVLSEADIRRVFNAAQQVAETAGPGVTHPRDLGVPGGAGCSATRGTVAAPTSGGRRTSTAPRAATGRLAEARTCGRRRARRRCMISPPTACPSCPPRSPPRPRNGSPSTPRGGRQRSGGPTTG